MQQESVSIPQPILEERAARRRTLLPLWIKVFTWFFMLTGSFVPLILIFGLTGTGVQLSLYGLETDTAFSATGMIITALYILKGVAAFGLWTEKDWAITVATADAVLGIAVCLFLMLWLPSIDTGHSFKFRLEIVFLIAYLVKVQKIKTRWLRQDIG
jgi:hypothetical protein